MRALAILKAAYPQNTTGITVTAGSWTAIAINSKPSDLNSLFTLSAGNIVISKACNLFIDLRFNPIAGNGVAVRLAKNPAGTPVYDYGLNSRGESDTIAAAGASQYVGLWENLQVGDVLQLQTYFQVTSEIGSNNNITPAPETFLIGYAAVLG